MPDLTAALDEIRNRHESLSLPFGYLPQSIMLSQADVPRLLAAVDAVLALHKPAGETGVDELWCTEWPGHGPIVMWPCPTYLAISRALTGEENPDA